MVRRSASSSADQSNSTYCFNQLCVIFMFGNLSPTQIPEGTWLVGAIKAGGYGPRVESGRGLPHSKSWRTIRYASCDREVLERGCLPPERTAAVSSSTSRS